MGIDIVLNNLNATKTTVNVYGETDLGNTVSNNASFGLFLQATNQALYNLNVTADPSAGGTTIKNLYMCGSAMHPGGGIMGAPGRNAALEMLKEI